MVLEELNNYYSSFKEDQLEGRYITFEKIQPLIKKLTKDFEISEIGLSEQRRPIYKIVFGKGAKRIFIWSQMHGNESTGTKAMFDLLNAIKNPPQSLKSHIERILDNCLIEFIPILNPDGAALFTRENANKIDLNRDAVARNAIESKILRRELEQFKPLFCFNLHDQRSIFNVENTKYPATVSFLAPSENIDRSLTIGRKQTMSVIVAMTNLLKQIIPNNYARFSDEFYPTATGDNFQKLGYNTILIESGHYPNDIEREQSRKFTFLSIIEGVDFIAKENYFNQYLPYFDIPNNDKKYLDKIYHQVKTEKGLESVGIQIKLMLKNNKITYTEYIEQKGDLSKYGTDLEIDAKKKDIFQLKLSNS